MTPMKKFCCHQNLILEYDQLYMGLCGTRVSPWLN